MTGCGLRRYTAENIYREHYSLMTYLKSWGGDHVLIILDGHVIGMVRRDRRSAWRKLKERTLRWWRLRFPKTETDNPAQEVANNDDRLGNTDLVHT
ncbi:hypothetical protein MASR1M60_13210 [Rhodocyclaceae bacterium]